MQLLTQGCQNKELITWTLREVIPRYPGMLAGGTPSLYV